MKKALLLPLIMGSLFCSGVIYHNNLDFARGLIRHGLWREATYRLEQELKKNQSAAVYNNLAICYEALGEEEKADQYYRRALEIEPNNFYLRENYQRFKNRKVEDEKD